VTKTVIGIELHKTLLLIVLRNMLAVIGHDMNQAAAEIALHSKREIVFNVPLLRNDTRGWQAVLVSRALWL
jgi:hypothetical protein